jgi:hypothetical protein
VNNIPVLGLEHINAIFDTGTTLILGGPAGIMDFFAPLELCAGAEEVADSPGYYSSTWANPAADQPSQPYLIFIYLLFYNLSTMRLRYSHLHLCWREGNQDFP